MTVSSRPSSSSGKPYKRLIVLVPGLWGSFTYWDSLRQQLAAEPGFGAEEALWLPFSQQLTLFSRGSVESLAKELYAQVVAAWVQNGGFEDVMLVGHSMGGMVVRQAYLLAAGAIPGTRGHEWNRSVSRIVLFASINRGFSLSHAPHLRLVAWLARHLFLSHIFTILRLTRGASFPTNLRIHWMQHFATMRQMQQSNPQEAIAPPLVVQLLGSKDGIVSHEDSQDIWAFPNGHELPIPGATHSEIYRLDIAPDPEQRYALIKAGFTSSFAGDRPDDSQSGPDHPPAHSIQRVVFLLHGIRASNVDTWIKGIEQRIEARDPKHTVVVHPTYGYFSAAQFALPGVRRRNIAVFQDWYTETLARYPNAKFNIIAHSNGTYILGNSLLTTPSMRFDNVVLAGSVLPQDFWRQFGDRLSHQVRRIRNDRANRDWPVALLCNGLRGLMMKDVGTAGFAGFKGTFVEHEVAYYAGDHGAALNPEHQDLLVDFVFGQPFQEPQHLDDSPGYFRQLSNAMPYVTSGLTIVVAVATARFLWQDGIFQVWRTVIALLSALGIYVILDII